MLLEIKCPYCNNITSFDEHLLNKTNPCPECKKLFVWRLNKLPPTLPSNIDITNHSSMLYIQRMFQVFFNWVEFVFERKKSVIILFIFGFLLILNGMTINSTSAFHQIYGAINYCSGIIVIGLCMILDCMLSSNKK